MKPVYLLATAVLQLQVAAGGPQLCYFDKNKLAPDYIIPCYTGSIDQPTYCCKKGSKCMEQSTCYDPESTVSYQYGCTDPNYSHENCPKKCNLDTSKSNWVGLVQCPDRSTNKPNWYCHHPDHCSSQCPTTPWDPAIKKPSKVDCPTWDKDEKYRALKAGTGDPLRDIMVLPVSDEVLSSYFSDHPTQKSSQLPASTITTTSTVSVGQPSVSSSASTSYPSSSASNATATPGTEHANSKALAAGLGAGIPAALAFIGGLVYLLFFRKRRHSEAEEEKSEVQNGAGLDGFRKSEHHDNGEVVHELDSPTTATELEGSTVDDRSPIHSTVSSPMTPRFSGQSQFTAARPLSGPLRPSGGPTDAHGNEIHELPG